MTEQPESGNRNVFFALRTGSLEKVLNILRLPLNLVSLPEVQIRFFGFQNSFVIDLYVTVFHMSRLARDFVETSHTRDY